MTTPEGTLQPLLARRDIRPLDAAYVEDVVSLWREERPDDAAPLARRWLTAKQEGQINDDLAILMAVRLGQQIPDYERLHWLVSAGWCRPPD